jgi:putative ABC transport system substrate-binding protein
MKRRKLITLLGGTSIAWPFAVRAQSPTKTYRLGYLALARIPNLVEALQTGLRELGFVEGRNLKVEYRFSGQQSERLDTLASELVQLGADAIVTVGTPAAFAAKRAATTISIVMAPVGDLVRSGIVASLAHPGGNTSHCTRPNSAVSAWRCSRKPCRE